MQCIPEQFDIMVTGGCNANCPFCVQEATYKSSSISDEEFIIGMREHFGDFYEKGGRRVVITGGEPTLVLPRVLAVLDVLSRFDGLTVKAMYTNGSRLLESVDQHSGQTVTQALSQVGLGWVNLSVHSYKQLDNRQILGLKNLPNVEDIARHLRECGISFRLNLTLHKGGIESYDQFIKYIEWGGSIGAKDIYVRDLFEYAFDLPMCPSDRNTVEFSLRHRINVAELMSKMRKDTSRFSYHGKTTEDMRDKTEYKFKYQSSEMNIFLARLTIGTEDPFGIPYLVYMPDGHLYRGWMGMPDIL